MLAVYIVFLALLSLSGADHANNTFLACCAEANLACPHMCSYPPPTPSLTDRLCVSARFSDYLKCYSGGKDNSECCRKAGVDKVGDGCLDFCTPAADKHISLQYLKCSQANDKISKCNRAANENFFGKLEMGFESLVDRFKRKNASDELDQ